MSVLIRGGEIVTAEQQYRADVYCAEVLDDGGMPQSFAHAPELGALCTMHPRTARRFIIRGRSCWRRESPGRMGSRVRR